MEVAHYIEKGFKLQSQARVVGPNHKQSFLKKIVRWDALKELYANRHLISNIVRYDLKLAYSNLFLGYIWTILDPLLILLVYVVLIQYILDRGGPLYPMLVFVSILCWKWFAASVSSALNSISSKSSIILTIRFPLAILPISTVIQNGVKFFLALAPLIVMGVGVYGIYPTWNYLWLPVVLMVQLMLLVGIALTVSVTGVYFKDLSNILQFVLRVGFYLSPGLYTIDRIPEKYLHLYTLNPFAGLMVSYKNILIFNKAPQFLDKSFVIALFFLIFGWLYFVATSKKIAKEL